MQRVIRPFAITLAALSLAGTAIAAQTKAPSSAAKAAPATQQTSASTSKPAKTKSTSTSLVATGKISTFDAATQALTLTTSKGEQQFTKFRTIAFVQQDEDREQAQPDRHNGQD